MFSPSAYLRGSSWQNFFYYWKGKDASERPCFSASAQGSAEFYSKNTPWMWPLKTLSGFGLCVTDAIYGILVLVSLWFPLNSILVSPWLIWHEELWSNRVALKEAEILKENSRNQEQ